MRSETQKRIEQYKAMLPGMKERVIAVALLLAMSVSMMASASFAWLTISRAPEVTGMSTTIAGNGNLEIALANGTRYQIDENGEYVLDENGNKILNELLAPGESQAGDSSASAKQTLAGANITWGNLINLSDSSYGLDNIVLRPSMLTSTLLDSPLKGKKYTASGRVDGDGYEVYRYASWRVDNTGLGVFDATNWSYGVRAIASTVSSSASADAYLSMAETLYRAAESAYDKARNTYVLVITNQTAVNEDGFKTKYGMDALQGLIQTYAQEQANALVADKLGGKFTPTDYADQIGYAYQLVLQMQNVLDKEGEALVYLANYQAFVKNKNVSSADSPFKSIEDLMLQYKKANDKLSAEEAEGVSDDYKKYNIQLKSMETYCTDYVNIRLAAEKLQELDNLKDTQEILWADISPAVGYLLDINNTKLTNSAGDEIEVGNLRNAGVSKLLTFKGDVDTALGDGTWKNIEQRLSSGNKDTLETANAGSPVEINVKVTAAVVYTLEMTAQLRTNIDKSNFISVSDLSDSYKLMSGISSDEELIARDTYGFAIDLWVRTNGTDVQQTGKLTDGTEVLLYEIIVDGKNGEKETVTAYLEGNNWYYYETKTVSNTDESTKENEENKTRQTGDLLGSVEELGRGTKKITKMLLTLEGQLNKTEQEVKGVDRNGKETTIYELEIPTGEKDEKGKDITTSVNAYKLTVDGVEYWYNAESHSELGTVADLGDKATVKTETVVTGYDGVSRIWEDYKAMLEDQLWYENSATLGKGSCYTFYADPVDTEKILNLLKYISIVFVNQDGQTLTTATLNTEMAYTLNGKTVVPLEVSQNNALAYEVKIQQNGMATTETKYGIMELEQNKATWITTIVYLNGEGLTNKDVLAVGEIDGTLNIQFGSNIALDGADEEELSKKYREIEATATANGNTSTNASQPISWNNGEYTGDVTVKLNITGDQPNKIIGFFTRAVGANGGSSGEKVAFSKNEDGTWSATFRLTSAGTYYLRTLIVDGVNYSLKDTPSVEIRGLSIGSVYTTLQEGLNMTADNILTAPVYAKLTLSGGEPSNVRAVFMATDGKMVQAQLHYDTKTGFWTGNAKFTNSGTYTLKYLYVDGEANELSSEQQKTYILSLGLRAQIYTSDQTEFEFKGNEKIAMEVELYDDTGKAIENKQDIRLYYRNEASTFGDDMYARLTWDSTSGRYKGEFEVKNAGVYRFSKLEFVDGNTHTVTIATVSPVLKAISTEPPVYNYGTTSAYQYAPNADAKLSVVLTDAQTAKMWAIIRNTVSGKEYTVERMESYTTIDADEGLYEFYFTVPKEDGTQDGEWKIVEIWLQGCADKNKQWIAIGATTYYKLSTASPAENAPSNRIQTYVLQTVNVTISDSTGKTYPDSEDSSKKFETIFSQEFNGKFMDPHTTNSFTFTVTDKNGRNISDLTGFELSLGWSLEYNGESETYGGYTYTTLDTSLNTLSQGVSGSGSYTVGASTLRLAGKYEGRLSVAVRADGNNGVAVGDYKLTYTVRSETPTVKITGISPTGTFDVDKNGTGQEHTENGATASFTDTTANVYFQCKYWILRHNYSRPSTKITISGMGAATKATLNFGSEYVYNGSTSTRGFEWTADGECTRNIGYFKSRLAYNDEKTPAGTITANQLVLTCNGVEYTFTIPTITINNPY